MHELTNPRPSTGAELSELNIRLDQPVVKVTCLVASSLYLQNLPVQNLNNTMWSDHPTADLGVISVQLNKVTAHLHSGGLYFVPYHVCRNKVTMLYHIRWNIHQTESLAKDLKAFYAT